MFEKSIIDKILSHLEMGAIAVVYPDGSKKSYGEGKPYFTITFNSAKAIRSMLHNVTLGFGASYMNGDIDIDGDLIQVGRLVSENQNAFGRLSLNRITKLRQSNRNSSQTKQIQHHYDLGNNFYKLWLDDSMAYSCAYFKHEDDSLEAAQQQKLSHVLRKLQLQPGMKLLDIGSGWGALLIKAAQDYGVQGYGVTLSQEQYEFSTKRIKDLGLDKLITIELKNYHDIDADESFDRVVSVGMYEHVGRGNHRNYMKKVKQLLVPGGISVLHTITNETEVTTDPWLDKYIFPGGYLPSIRETVALLPHYDLRLIDYENLRIHYAKTTAEWLRRYEACRETVLERYDERFYRMWRLYLAGSSSGFHYDKLGLGQFVFTNGLNNDLPLTRDHLYS